MDSQHCAIFEDAADTSHLQYRLLDEHEREEKKMNEYQEQEKT